MILPCVTYIVTLSSEVLLIQLFKNSVNANFLV